MRKIILVFSVAFAFSAQAFGFNESIHTPKTLGDSIERTIFRYNQLQASLFRQAQAEAAEKLNQKVDKPSADSVKSELDVHSLIYSQQRRDSVDRAVWVSGTRIASLKNRNP